MKKTALLIVFALIIQGIATSQPCLPSGIIFNTQEDIDNFQTNHPNCTEVGGNLIVDGESIYNLAGLNVITHIGGNLEIMGCDILASISDLSNLTSLDGSLVIAGNDALIYLTGLEGLTSIGNNLEIRSNQYLLNCSGLENVTSIGGGLYLFYNYNFSSFDGLEKLNSIGEGLEFGAYIFGILLNNPALESLTGLSDLTSIGGPIKILGCDILTSLSGIDFINPGTITNLTIASNPQLSSCAVQSICEYLVSPNGTISIHDNAPGCGDQAEIEYACQTIGIPDINLETEFSIYPNPAKKKLFISSKNEIVLEKVIIYNQFGQKVFQETQILNVVDISMLPKGLYIIELLSDELKMRNKLIIE